MPRHRPYDLPYHRPMTITCHCGAHVPYGKFDEHAHDATVQDTLDKISEGLLRPKVLDPRPHAHYERRLVNGVPTLAQGNPAFPGEVEG